jgi:flavin prenyltransferase
MPENRPMSTRGSHRAPRRGRLASEGLGLTLAVTGASGMRLPIHLLRCLARRDDVALLHLVVSAGAAQVLRHELPNVRPGAAGLLEAADLTAEQRQRVVVHRDSELDAPIASGSHRLAGMLVVPCSGSTLAALATGTANTLVHRAGAVALKERWPLVLGVRETPYSLVHLENMRRLAYASAIIAPPIPAFYVGGEEMGRFLDAYALRLLDHLGLPATEATDLRWRDGG